MLHCWSGTEGVLSPFPATILAPVPAAHTWFCSVCGHVLPSLVARTHSAEATCVFLKLYMVINMMNGNVECKWAGQTTSGAQWQCVLSVWGQIVGTPFCKLLETTLPSFFITEIKISSIYHLLLSHSSCQRGKWVWVGYNVFLTFTLDFLKSLYSSPGVYKQIV